jgi:hypothetical protein
MPDIIRRGDRNRLPGSGRLRFRVYQVPAGLRAAVVEVRLRKSTPISAA